MMNMHMTRHLPFDGTYNIRDLGGYRAGDRETQWRAVLRADGLHRMSPAGAGALAETGLKTVIDLRHKHEAEAAPNPFQDNGDVRYLNIPLFADLAPGASRRVGAQGQDVLRALYISAFDERGSVIRDVLSAIGEAEAGGVLFHCTAGKDRTGITAALVLAIAGVARDQIIDDYATTATMIAPLVEELVGDATAKGWPEAAYRAYLGADPATMEGALAHLDTRYGGIGAYLDHIGFSAADRLRIETRLIGDQPRQEAV